jgi:hypothetical protein
VVSSRRSSTTGYRLASLRDAGAVVALRPCGIGRYIPEGCRRLAGGSSPRKRTIPPEGRVNQVVEPGGFAAIIAANANMRRRYRVDPMVAAIPAGSDGLLGSVSGGIVAALLNHRLQAGIPTGCGSGRCVLDEGDLFVGESVELVDEGVDFAIGVLDLMLERGTLVVGFELWKPNVKIEHLLD